jgi:hypothetical protein
VADRTGLNVKTIFRIEFGLRRLSNRRKSWVGVEGDDHGEGGLVLG